MSVQFSGMSPCIIFLIYFSNMFSHLPPPKSISFLLKLDFFLFFKHFLQHLNWFYVIFRTKSTGLIGKLELYILLTSAQVLTRLCFIRGWKKLPLSLFTTVGGNQTGMLAQQNLAHICALCIAPVQHITNFMAPSASVSITFFFIIFFLIHLLIYTIAYHYSVP